MNSSNSSRPDGDDAVNHHGNADTIAKLEEMFKVCPFPDETQCRQMSEELGLQPRQVEFWYQNKRIRVVAAVHQRLQSNALRMENKKLESENLIMLEALKDSLCLSCKMSDLRSEEESELSSQILRAENLLLKRESESLLAFLTMNGINPMQHTTSISSHDIEQGSLINQAVGIPNQHTPNRNRDHVIPAMNQLIPNHPSSIYNQLLSITKQGIPAPTPTLAQNIPILNLGCIQNIPSLDQNISALGHTKMHSPYLDLEAKFGNLNNKMLPQPVMSQSTDIEDALMRKIANNAMEELMKLLSINGPFWFMSLCHGKFILEDDVYERTFGKINRLTGTHARRESSKDSTLVNMGGTQLIEMFLNSEKWVDLFPTIVKKAQTIQVFESGLLGNRNGALQLMNAETHILSNLVPTRKFLFLRYCKQIKKGVWAIGDVSIRSSKYKITDSCAWRLPSGCLIKEISQGSCEVTWVEHVQVNDMIQTHELFREVVCEDNAYGAKRWVLTLQRMCERFACVSAETIPSCDVGGVIKSLEGRKSVMNMAHRMVKIFSENLDMQDNGKFPSVTSMTMTDGEVRLSVRVNKTMIGVPKGMIFCAATSFWLPLSPQNVLDFLMDKNNQPKWHVLYDEKAGTELQRISTGTNPDNYISIIRPFIPKYNNLLILQESYGDALGSMLVYTPLDMEAMQSAIKGDDMSTLPLLPSGITVSLDGQSNLFEGHFKVDKPKGSLVTLMSQVLAPETSSQMDTIDLKLATHVTSQVTSTVEKIKAALNCSDLK